MVAKADQASNVEQLVLTGYDCACAVLHAMDETYPKNHSNTVFASLISITIVDMAVSLEQDKELILKILRQRPSIRKLTYRSECWDRAEQWEPHLTI